MKKSTLKNKLLEALNSYNKYEDLYAFVDVIFSNIRYIDKELLVNVLSEILSNLNDNQEIQDAIIGDVLDCITAWSKPPKTDEKLYKLYTEFNPDKV